MRRRAALATATACSAAAAAGLAHNVDAGPVRFLRSAYHSALVGLDYGRCQRHPAGSAERSDAVAAAHERAAARLLHVCRLHGGLYNKLGQFVASMSGSAALPSAYRLLSACEDRAAPVGLPEVRAVVEAELHRPLRECFRCFDQEPVAAASLAQVHRAVTLDGVEVAVKVQYAKLQAQVESDVRTLRFLAWAMGRAFPGYGYEWLVPEFEASVRAELDFTLEADNARRTAAAFADWPELHVPYVLPALSSSRVLTMEWIRGVKLSDAAELSASGLDPRQCALVLSQAFSAMIFDWGFVHCDPHAGNLLARPMPTTSGAGPADARSGGAFSIFGRRRHRPQLVLLDHGMYRELKPEFRREYCRLWRALLTRAHSDGRAAAAALGIPAAEYDTLSLLLTHRPASSRGAIGSNMSAGEREQMRARFKTTTAADINGFLESLPRDMLFVMRTWSLVRSLNRRLGGTSRERFLIIGDAATRGLFGVSWGGQDVTFLRRAWLRIRLGWMLLRTRLVLHTVELAFAIYRACFRIQPYTAKERG